MLSRVLAASLLSLSLLAWSGGGAEAQVNNCTAVANGATTAVTGPGGTCRNVNNTSGQTACVMTGDADHWTRFIASTNPMPGITLSTCGPACTGGWVDTQNFCWRTGTSGGSCDAACSAAGYTCNLEATRSVGIQGTNLGCQTVMDGLAMAGTGAPTTVSLAIGCSVTGTTRRRGTTSTTCAATATGYVRACACRSPGSSCRFNNQVIQHGQCITAYLNSFVDNCAGECSSCALYSGPVCCSNGVISNPGNYQNLACIDTCGSGSCN